MELFSKGIEIVGDVEKFRIEALEQLADQMKRAVDELAQRHEIIESYAKILYFTKSYPTLVKNHFGLGVSLRYEPEQVDLLHSLGLQNLLQITTRFIPVFVSVVRKKWRYIKLVSCASLFIGYGGGSSARTK